MIEIILGVIVVISFCLIIFVIQNNLFQLAIIKIDKAEEDISMYLDKKKELLNRSRPIIKKELKKDDFLVELEADTSTFNNFDLHNLLKDSYNKLFRIIDENEKLMKSDSLMKLLDDLNSTEENIVGAIKFYNDTVVEFNKLVVSFPSNIVALFRHYKKKDFYNNEKREIFEILNRE
ncbi:MAG: LemA family protein [Bacilli bacterium]|nr:LemA family protein [Bacilli bacterium]